MTAYSDHRTIEPANASSPYASLPGSLWLLFGLGALAGLLTPNPFLTAVSILLLPVFMTLLWRQGETPVLLFAVSFQWLQVTAKVFHANFLGIDVTSLSNYTLGSELPSLASAIWLSLVGLTVLAVGMRLGMRKLGPVRWEEANHEVAGLSTNRAFLLYLLCTMLAAVLQANAWAAGGGLVQILRGAVSIKWVGFFILGYIVLKRKEGYPFFAAAVVIEFVSGIGFFSGFKTVIFVTLLVIFTVRHRLKPTAIAAGFVLFGALLIFGAGWTSIKGEFRGYLNQGTNSQATLVSRSDQFDKLGELIGDLEWYDISVAMGELFGRIAYVDYFALSIDYVPEVLPHEGGSLWKQSIMHTLTPRLFFPSKPPLVSDSETTMRYTGLVLAGEKEGTSISIGYMGESYIDFGRYGMFFPIFILGVIWGFMYYYFTSRAQSLIIGYAFATALLISAYQFEMAGIKLVGGMVLNFLVLALILRFGEKHLVSWLSREGGAKQVAPTGTLAYKE